MSANFPLDKLLKSRRGMFREDIDWSKEGRVPPAAIDIEQEVLGCILIQGDAIERVINVFGDNEDRIFYEIKHDTIYKAMLRLYTRREAIDLITLSDELKRSEELERIGGYYYLAELSNKVATAANVEYYAIIVKEKYLYRSLIVTSSQIAKVAYEQSLDVFDLIEQASQQVFKISQAGIRKKASDLKTLLKVVVKQIEDLQKRKETYTGVASGFRDLDNLTAGFQRSDMIIIAARPSTGKTALALAFARNAAVERKEPVLFFSLEMSEVQLVQRMLCAETMTDQTLVRTARLSSADMTRIAGQIDKLSQSEIYIDDTPGISIIEMAAKARRMKMEKKIGMIIIDYLQLVTPVKDNKANREQEIAQISRSLKALAKELEIPVIALAQLNRSIEQRGGDKKPLLSDLRESGSIEQDADVVIALSRPESYGMQAFADGSSTKDIIVIDILKQRNGPVGEVKLKFLRQFGRFESLSSVYSKSDFSPRDELKSARAAEDIIQSTPPMLPDNRLNPDDAPF
ncbi:MAG: replicative DNA helicase [Chloroherpetonaceae bacterium]|nr:replicative DNA helicase [Chloroherpetonaceae bacterium]